MPQGYSRKDVVAAFRAENPDAANIDDNKILEAIGAEDPGLVQGAHDFTPAASRPLHEAAKTALSQGKEVVKGAVGAVTGIPGMISEVAGIGKDAIMGNVLSVATRTGKLGKGLVDMFAQPAYQSGKGVGELLAPGSQDESVNPESEEWKQAAQHSGAQAGGIVVGELAGKAARYVKKKVPGPLTRQVVVPEKLRARAEASRQYVKENPVMKSVENINVTKPASIIKPAVSATKNVASRVKAPLYERAAKVMEGDLPARLEKARAAEVAGELDAPAMEEAYTPPQQTPPRNLENEAFLEELRANQRAQQRYEDAYNQSRMPQEEPPVVQEPYTAPPQQPPRSIINEQFMQDLRNTPQTAPAAMPANPDVAALQQQIKPAGRAGQTWVARNATELYELMPELRDLPMGENFRVRATNAFKNFEAEMQAQQASISPETLVPKATLVDDLLPIKAEAALANRPAVLKILNKVDELPPSIPWKDFLDVKEGIRKSPGFGTDPFMRRAYGAFMEAGGKVSKELAKANRKFSMGMRLLEHSRIDPISGQFLRRPN